MPVIFFGKKKSTSVKIESTFIKKESTFLDKYRLHWPKENCIIMIWI